MVREELRAGKGELVRFRRLPFQADSAERWRTSSAATRPSSRACASGPSPSPSPATSLRSQLPAPTSPKLLASSSPAQSRPRGELLRLGPPAPAVESIAKDWPGGRKKAVCATGDRLGSVACAGSVKTKASRTCSAPDRGTKRSQSQHRGTTGREPHARTDVAAS